MTRARTAPDTRTADPLTPDARRAVAAFVAAHNPVKAPVITHVPGPLLTR